MSEGIGMLSTLIMTVEQNKARQLQTSRKEKGDEDIFITSRFKEAITADVCLLRQESSKGGHQAQLEQSIPYLQCPSCWFLFPLTGREENIQRQTASQWFSHSPGRVMSICVNPTIPRWLGPQDCL